MSHWPKTENFITLHTLSILSPEEWMAYFVILFWEYGTESVMVCTWLSETRCCLQCLEICLPSDCPNSLSFWLEANILRAGDVSRHFLLCWRTCELSPVWGHWGKSHCAHLWGGSVWTQALGVNASSHMLTVKNLWMFFWSNWAICFIRVTHEGQEFMVSVPIPALLSSFHCDQSDLHRAVCGGGCHSWLPVGPSAKHLLCCATISCVFFGETHALRFCFLVCFIFLFFETQSHGPHSAIRLTMFARLTLNSWSSGLSLPSVGVTAVHLCAQLFCSSKTVRVAEFREFLCSHYQFFLRIHALQMFFLVSTLFLHSLNKKKMNLRAMRGLSGLRCLPHRQADLGLILDVHVRVGGEN